MSDMKPCKEIYTLSTCVIEGLHDTPWYQKRKQDCDKRQGGLLLKNSYTTHQVRFLEHHNQKEPISSYISVVTVVRTVRLNLFLNSYDRTRN